MNSESRAGRVRLDIYLPSGTDGVQLKRKIRDTALNQGKTVSGWVGDAIQRQLSENRHSTVGVKKAASLLIALGPERIRATPMIMKELSNEEINLVSSEIVRMQRISPEERELILQEAMRREMQHAGVLDKSVLAMSEEDAGVATEMIRHWIKEEQEPSEGFSFKIQP